MPFCAPSVGSFLNLERAAINYNGPYKGNIGIVMSAMRQFSEPGADVGEA